VRIIVEIKELFPAIERADLLKLRLWGLRREARRVESAWKRLLLLLLEGHVGIASGRGGEM
jgi:hypothetical protein